MTSTVTLYHMLYNITIICAEEPAELSAQIRRYSHVGELPLPDNTVASVVAKAHVPFEGTTAATVLFNPEVPSRSSQLF